MRSRSLHRVASVLAGRLVRGYPQPWRERYEGELLALLEDSPARLRDVVDLTRGLLVERARAFFEPGDRPGLISVLVVLEGVARGCATMCVPFTLGLAARRWLGFSPHLASMVMVANIAMWAVTIVQAVRTYSPTAAYLEPQPALFSNRASHVWLGALFSITFLASWCMPPDEVGFNLWFYAVLFGNQMFKPRPWQLQMVRALQRLRTARHEMKWAVLELQRCERLAADGTPAPLEEARAAVARLTGERDEAMAILHDLGYRATLQSGGSQAP